MPKKLIKRFMPSHETIKKHPSLAFLGRLLEDPYLLHLNRHSVSLAFLVGVFCAFLPIPAQMVVAAATAIVVRCNLPIAVALVWITNPITIPPIFFGCYEFGVWLLKVPPQDFTIELSWHWLANVFVDIWRPLIVGSLTAGIFFSLTSYIFVKLFWRFHVGMQWRKRQQRGKKNATIGKQ